MLTKVSVVIPAYNEEKYINHCLESLSSLDYTNLDVQIIVVDNGSYDKTREIAQKYNAEIITFPDGKTIASVRNHGALYATGDILAFLDADCITTHDWLLNAMRWLDEGVGVVGSRPVAPLERSTWVQRCWGIIMPKSLEKPIFADWLSSSNIILRRELFDKVNGFDERLETCEDVDIGFKLNKVTKILYAPDVKAFHLREPRTLFDLFKNEMWHGKSLYKSIFQHRMFLRQLRILLIPLFVLINLFLIIIGLIDVQSNMPLVLIISIVSIPVIMTIRNLSRIKDPILLGQCFLVNTTYILGRSFSLVYSIISLLFSKSKSDVS